MWSDTEIFVTEQGVSAPIARVMEQLNDEGPHVGGAVSFSWAQLSPHQAPSSARLYRDYQAYIE